MKPPFLAMRLGGFALRLVPLWHIIMFISL
jgi:hypothetical protein